jgi:hypothetical protein
VDARLRHVLRRQRRSQRKPRGAQQRDRPADLLSGAFDLTGAGNAFTLAGFGSFANLVAGTSFGGLDVLLDDGSVGAFLATIVVHASGSNASGFAGALPDMTFVIRGDVAAVAAVPEPETYVLLVTGLVVLARVAQKRRQRRVV